MDPALAGLAPLLLAQAQQLRYSVAAQRQAAWGGDADTSFAAYNDLVEAARLLFPEDGVLQLLPGMPDDVLRYYYSPLARNATVPPGLSAARLSAHLSGLVHRLRVLVGPGAPAGSRPPLLLVTPSSPSAS